MNYCLEDGNMTSIALHQYFSKEKNYQPFFVIPFSSQRKYSAVSFNEFGTVYLGASQFIFENLDDKCHLHKVTFDNMKPIPALVK